MGMNGFILAIYREFEFEFESIDRLAYIKYIGFELITLESFD